MKPFRISDELIIHCPTGKGKWAYVFVRACTAMPETWIKGEGVTAQHPIGGRDVGSDTVLASFDKVADITGGGNIRLQDQSINAGTDMAVGTGVEVGTLIIAGHEAHLNQRVTNVYQQQGGVWKLAHHHTDLSPDMMKILEVLNEAA